jgi:streptogramin lyase
MNHMRDHKILDCMCTAGGDSMVFTSKGNLFFVIRRGTHMRTNWRNGVMHTFRKVYSSPDKGRAREAFYRALKREEW